jgi:hypothetical protein
MVLPSMRAKGLKNARKALPNWWQYVRMDELSRADVRLRQQRISLEPPPPPLVITPEEVDKVMAMVMGPRKRRNGANASENPTSPEPGDSPN